MERRFVLRLIAIVGLAALSLPPGSRAAGNTPAPGTIMTIAGTGQVGFSGDGGPAAQARLNDPRALAADTAGNLFIADTGNARVRRISPDGIIKTVAGSGKDSFSGDGGPATRAGTVPIDVFVDSADSLYITDGSGSMARIRKVSASGIITTVAGGGNPADGLGDGGPATSARLLSAVGITLDARGNLFIADFGDHRVRMVTPDGVIRTVAGTGKPGFAGG